MLETLAIKTLEFDHEKSCMRIIFLAIISLLLVMNYFAYSTLLKVI